jgi:hypothetical protein
MVVDAQNVAHETKVTIGIRTADKIEIVEGLEGGETVVVEGNYALPDGTKVEPSQKRKKEEDDRRKRKKNDGLDPRMTTCSPAGICFKSVQDLSRKSSRCNRSAALRCRTLRGLAASHRSFPADRFSAHRDHRR